MKCSAQDDKTQASKKQQHTRQQNEDHGEIKTKNDTFGGFKCNFLVTFIKVNMKKKRRKPQCKKTVNVPDCNYFQFIKSDLRQHFYLFKRPRTFAEHQV